MEQTTSQNDLAKGGSPLKSGPFALRFERDAWRLLAADGTFVGPFESPQQATTYAARWVDLRRKESAR